MKKSYLLISVLIIFSILTYGCNNGTKTPIDESDYSQTISSESQSPSTPTPIPTPTPIIEDTLAGRFFGPLYTVAEPKVVEHHHTRAIYIGRAAFGDHLDKVIEIANNSVINGLVVDIKESNGVLIPVENELANEIGAVIPSYNVENLMKKAKENDIRIIGRMVIFKDNYLAEARPDLCIQDEQGNPVRYAALEGNSPFLNPYEREVWEYNIAIAQEAIAMGFDEIQYDYVRFPTGSTAEIESEYYGEEGTYPTKVEAINRFLTESRIKIQDELGVPLAADIFGIVMTSKSDGNLIGQDWESLGRIGLDTLSPMIYPSHYGPIRMNGILFENPSQDTFAFLDAVFQEEKFSKEEGFSILRPYIQAYSYSREQIFGQIDALEKNGITQYIYWNPWASYSIENMKTD